MKKIYAILICIIFVGAFLRFYRITTDPPGLYIDEVSLGVNSYDILKTGKDQYGISFPIAFKSTGEYKMPVYVYMVSAAMAIFGKNEFSIRFFSALLGTATIGVMFFLSNLLLRRQNPTKEYSKLISLFIAFIFAISPMSLQFSRAGFEATVALFFYATSIFLFLDGLDKKNKALIFLATICLVLSFYSYNSYKLLAPFTACAGCIFLFREKILRKTSYLVFIIFVLLCLPMGLFTLTDNGLIRFQQTTAFSQITNSNLLERYLIDATVFIKNYLSYFSITYLFRYGDQINRHHVEGFGLFYLWELPYLLLGIYSLIKTKNYLLRFFVLFLFLIGPILPAFTLPSPHALRYLYGIIPLTICIGLGFGFVLQHRKWVMPIVFITGFFIVVELVYYLHYYYYHYPNNSLIDWGGGCKGVAMQIAKQASKYQTIVVDGSVKCSQDYFSFYAPHTTISYISGSLLTKPLNKTLLISSKNKQKVATSYLYSIYLPNLNRDIFANFYAL